MSGSVTRQNLCQAPAPSTSAASYSTRGTPLSAARKMSMAAPLLQTVMSTSDGFDHSSLDSHSGTRLGPGQLALTCLNNAKWWCTWPVSAAATSNARKYAAPSREAPTNSRAATAATTPGTQRDQPDLGRPPAT